MSSGQILGKISNTLKVRVLFQSSRTFFKLFMFMKSRGSLRGSDQVEPVTNCNSEQVNTHSVTADVHCDLSGTPCTVQQVDNASGKISDKHVGSE